jgi:hypothetical protein
LSTIVPPAPSNLPVLVADATSVSTIIGNMPYFEFCSLAPARTAEGKMETRYVVIARIRMTEKEARFVRDEINKHLAILAEPQGQAN